MNILYAILIAVIGSLVLVGLTVALYMVLQRKVIKKRDDINFRNTFLFVIVAIAIVARIICILTLVDPTDFVATLGKVYVTFYYSFSALGFGGQPETEGIGALIYHGSAAWLALTFASIISLNVSYGLSSRIQLLFAYKKRDFFIFTSFSEDSIVLAQSIQNTSSKNHKSYKIIFVADQSQPFNRENEIHQKIRMNGYLFVNYKKILIDEVPTISILKRLHLIKLNKKSFRTNKIHFFALENSKDLKGLESYNSGIVFDEINALLNQNKFDVIKDISKKLKFYVLTNNTVNYEFYEKMTYASIDKVDPTGEKYKKILDEVGIVNIPIELVNEANLVGYDLIKNRKAIVTKRIAESKEINHSEFPEYKVCVFGFGQNGQNALCNLFIDSVDASDEKISKSKRFVAHVFDPYIDDYSGVFSRKHPEMLYISSDELNVGKEIDAKKCLNYESIKEAYGGSTFVSDVEKYMPLPIVCYHKINANRFDVLNMVEQVEDNKINALVIAMGSDDKNIELANSLIQSLRQKICASNNLINSKLDIFVNIFDESNVGRLLLNDNDYETFASNINVIPFGIRNNMYSYESIVDETDETIMNYIYNLNDKEYEQNIDDIIKDFKKDESLELRLVSKTVKATSISNVYYRMLSSMFSSFFAPYFFEYLKTNDALDLIKGKTLNEAIAEGSIDSRIQYLGQLEHYRWFRFMICFGALAVNGGTYKFDHAPEFSKSKSQSFASVVNLINKEYDPEGKKNKLAKDYYKVNAKIHNCLVSYDLLDEYLKKYDYANVVIGAAVYSLNNK